MQSQTCNSYLNNRWHRTKINQNFSSWEEFFQGVSQGSADFARDKDLNSLIKRLEYISLLTIEWFQNNNMKLNQGKCHLQVSCYKHENVWAQVGSEIICKSNKQMLLGWQIDRNLNVNECVSLLCKKAGKKLSVFAKLSNFRSIKQRRALMKSFTESQFGYYPLIWMFYGRGVNNKINHLHERSLCIV